MSKESMLAQLIAGEKLFPAPTKTERPADSAYEFLIGIGKDHTARITMEKEAYEVLMALTTEPHE